MKVYTCRRCGLSFQGRHDRCPRCGIRFAYERDGKYFDALGNELVLDRKKEFVKKIIPNPNAPRN